MRPGDIVFERSNGFVAQLIRFFEGAHAEVNHVAIMTSPCGEKDGFLVEATPRGVEYHLYSQSQWNGSDVAIYRNTKLTDMQLADVVLKALDYRNRPYGFIKIIAHALDWFLGGRYVFRRFAGMDKYPICSWVVAHAYRDGAHVEFGVTPNEADPQDIWKWVTTSPDWIVVRPLSRW